ncbi:hypothetical protein [Dictyobacter aurantiacus]|uniref:Glycosyltransferase RgtA/B/C/D-like domain-containing protein n=1 Tax=Dictyobacter aurantiacus TaxID=1936993 RepID=A0A401ZAV7_9CHLR|nr:hypothetical protein [Dictyobacter aurantiacus]GCE04010.1 hypothetical protein KDAU_13390 [Dictyobacter aurantiacus]
MYSTPHILEKPERSITPHYKKTRIAVALVTVMMIIAVSMRFILIINNWPVTNSDESIMGLMALHISHGGEWPLMYYGQGYMGPIEAYIAAPIFRLLGPSVFSLRIGLLLFFGLFLIAMYRYSKFLYTEKFALFICLLLCLESKEIIIRQLKAIGGYPELPFLAVTICILVTTILWRHDKTSTNKAQVSQYLLYFLLGLVASFAIWTDPLIFPFVMMGLFLLIMFIKKDLLSLSGLLLLCGFMIGIFPIILHNITAPFSESTIANMAGLANASDGKSYSLLQRMGSAFFISIPSATGYPQICPANMAPTLGEINTGCLLLRGSWSLGYVVLWILAVWNAVKNIRQEAATTREARQKQIIEYSRLMLLVGGGVTIAIYSQSTLAAVVPEPTSRYLICLLLTIPAVLWQIWPGKNSALKNKTTKIPGIVLLLRLCMLFTILCAFSYGVFETFTDIPAAQQFYRQDTKLVQHLEALQATRIYSEYWTCNRLIFRSKEKILCSVLNPDLTPGMNRYPPYHTAVKKTKNPSYVFPLNSQHEQNFIKIHTQDNTLQNYQYSTYEGYSIYLSKESI